MNPSRLNTLSLSAFLIATPTLLLLLGGNSAQAIDPENVLVLYSADEGVSGDGFQIADHYQQARQGVHRAGISGLSTLPDEEYRGVPDADTISAEDYLNVVRPQILSIINAIESAGGSIDVIVTTKGMPLRINAGQNPGGFSSWNQYSSLESELTRIDSIDTINEMGNQSIIAAFPQFDFNLGSNPYYQYNPVPGPFTGQGGIRLTSRLDGYSVQSVTDSIDRAQKVFLVPFGNHIVADDTLWDSVDQMTLNGSSGNGFGDSLVNVVTGLYGDDPTKSPLLYEGTNTAVTASERAVLGYVSHGTNDGGGGLGNDYLGKFESGVFVPGEVQFELADGAISLTHESFNAESFDSSSTQTQGMVADWIEVGGTAGLGHVAEPGNGYVNVTNEDLLFEMMLPAAGTNAASGEAGLTFVEAAWGATRQLSYVNTVVGDPLMRWQQWLPGDANLDGIVDISDFGILQVNFFQSGSFADGDFNGDGIVDISDFGILQANFFQSVNNLSVNATIVPEPSAGLLMFLGLCLSGSLTRTLNPVLLRKR